MGTPNVHGYFLFCKSFPFVWIERTFYLAGKCLFVVYGNNLCRLEIVGTGGLKKKLRLSLVWEALLEKSLYYPQFDIPQKPLSSFLVRSNSLPD